MQQTSKKESKPSATKQTAKRGSLGKALATALHEKGQANKAKRENPVPTTFDIAKLNKAQLEAIATTRAGIVGTVTPFNGLLRGDIEGIQLPDGWGCQWIRTKDQTNMGSLKLVATTEHHLALMREGTYNQLVQQYNFSEHHARKFMQARERGKYPIAKRLGEILNDASLLGEWMKHPEALGAETRDEWAQRNHKLLGKLSPDNELVLARMVKFVSTERPKHKKPFQGKRPARKSGNQQ